MKKNKISYSDLLVEFIEPILDGTEDADEFMVKAKFGMVAWNYHVSDQNELPHDGYMKAILKTMSALHSEGKKMLNKLVLRKELHFAQYNQFILKVEPRYYPDGTVTLYVESVPAEMLEW